MIIKSRIDKITDPRLTTKDKISFFLEILTMRFRGMIFKLFHFSSQKKLSIGKYVKLKYISYISFGNNNTINDFVEIQGLSKNGINLGDNVNLGKGSIIRGTGSITNIGVGFSCGNNFACGDFSFFGCSGGITIGDDCIMGQSIRMHSQNHNFDSLDSLIRNQGTTSKGIKIGNNCWIGSGVVILDGVTIGNGVVIGSNTLINKSIPDNVVVVGNPMRIVRSREKFLK
ncbi:acyltransferase [Streptococcus uberis]|nr:acyltransferase [Streptococcus uberis]MCK1195883.1 acyltransferase [Streptococcus uberis]